MLLGVEIDVLEDGGGLGSWLVCWLGDGVLLAIMVFNDFRRSGFTLTLRRDDVFPVSVFGFSFDRNGAVDTIDCKGGLAVVRLVSTGGGVSDGYESFVSCLMSSDSSDTLLLLLRLPCVSLIFSSSPL